MSSVNPFGLINYSNYYLNPIAYYSKIWEKFDMDLHTHPYYEIMYVEDGICTIMLYSTDKSGEPHESSVILSKDMAIFINSNVYHRLIVSQPTKMLHLEFERIDNSIINGSIDFGRIIQNTQHLKQLFTENKIFYIIKNAHEVISPIKRIHAELVDNIVLNEDNYFLVQAYIIELFIKISKIYRDNTYKGGIVYIRKAISYIRNNYTNKVTVEMISKELGVSNGYLQKLIKDETGKTLFEIVNNYRIEKAKLLINSTTFPLIDIAIECGFNNRQNFYHIFKNIVGMSPQEFRKGATSNNLYYFNNEYANTLYNELRI